MRSFARPLTLVLTLSLLLVCSLLARPARADMFYNVTALEDGQLYAIRNTASGLCLSYSGSGIVMAGEEDCVWIAHQVGSQWYFTPTNVPDSYLNCYYGKKAANGSQAILYPYGPAAKDTASLWKLEWKNDCARLINVASGYALGAPDAWNLGSAVNVYSAKSAPNAYWTFEDLILKEELIGHFAFKNKDLGALRRFVGRQRFTIVYVSTPNHPWTDAKRREVRSFSDSSIRIMENAAKAYNVNLKLSYTTVECAIPVEFGEWAKDTWLKYALNTLGANSVTALEQRYRENGTYNNAPVLFMFNIDDRSYTWPATIGAPNRDEYCVFFCGGKTHKNYLSHEVYHLFGAVDLYDLNKEGVAQVSSRYFPKSNMQCTGDDMDPLTAYLLGWTDALNDKAIAFLRESKRLR